MKLEKAFRVGSQIVVTDDSSPSYEQRGLSFDRFAFKNAPASSGALFFAKQMQFRPPFTKGLVDADAFMFWYVPGEVDESDFADRQLPADIIKLAVFTFTGDDYLLVIRPEDSDALQLRDIKRRSIMIFDTNSDVSNFLDSLAVLPQFGPCRSVVWPGVPSAVPAESSADEQGTFLGRHACCVRTPLGKDIDVDAALAARSGPTVDITYVSLMSQNVNFPHVLLQPLAELTVLELCIQFFFRSEMAVAGMFNAPRTTRLRYTPEGKVADVRKAAGQYGNHTATANRYLEKIPDEVVLYDIKDTSLNDLLARALAIVKAYMALPADPETEKRLKARDVFYRIKQIDTTEKLADRGVTGTELFVAEFVVTGRGQAGLDWADIGIGLFFETIAGAI